MDESASEPELLATVLEDYATRFAAYSDLGNPCWIIEESPHRLPWVPDLSRNLLPWGVTYRFEFVARRKIWLYEVDLPKASPMLGLFKELGAEFAQSSQLAKSLVYVDWCPHCLANADDSISHSFEALFPEPCPFRNNILFPATTTASVSRISTHNYGQYQEIHIPNLALGVVEALGALAERLRNPLPPDEFPKKGEFCCPVAEAEERQRLKPPEEILPIIQKLKMRWQRADDYGPTNSQELIDDIWSDMVPLGWTLPPCPKLSDTRAPTRLTDPPAYKKLWREYHTALSQAEAVARAQVSSMAAGEIAPSASKENDSGSEPARTESLSRSCEELKEPTLFSGGMMVFYPNLVELCGVAICYGKRSQTRRTILDLLSKKQSNDSFAFYSGEELAEQAGLAGGENSASGAIRDLRDDVIRLLREKKNIDCGREDVVLSGGPGYRFADCITVQDGDRPEISGITDMDDTSDVRNVRNQDVPNVRNDDDSDDAAGKRRAWILLQLEKEHKLQSPAVVKQFKCSLKTAQRDLQSLNAEDQVEFVGAPRTGYYRLKDPPEPSQQSS